MSTRIIEGFGSCPLQQPSFVPGGLLGDNASTASGQLSHSTVPQGPDIAKGWDAFSGEGVNLCFTVKPETSDEPDIGNVINNFFGGGTGRSSGTGGTAPTGSTPTGGQTTHGANVVHNNVLTTAWESKTCPTNTSAGLASFFARCASAEGGCSVMYTAAGSDAPATLWSKQYLSCPPSTTLPNNPKGTPGANFTCNYPNGGIGCPVQGGLGQEETSPAWQLSGAKSCTSAGASLPEGSYRWSNPIGCPAWTGPSGTSPSPSSVTTGCTPTGFFGDVTMSGASDKTKCYPQEACTGAYGYTGTGSSKPVGVFSSGGGDKRWGQCNACGGTFNGTCSGQTGWYDAATTTCKSIDLGVGSNSSSNICQKCYDEKGALRPGTPTSPPECLPCGEIPSSTTTSGHALSWWSPVPGVKTEWTGSDFMTAIALDKVCTKGLVAGSNGTLQCPTSSQAAVDYQMFVPQCGGTVLDPYQPIKTQLPQKTGVSGFQQQSQLVMQSAQNTSAERTGGGWYYGPSCTGQEGWMRPNSGTAQYSITCEKPQTCPAGEYNDAATGKCVPCHAGTTRPGYTYTGSTQGGLCPQGSGDQEACMFKVNNGPPSGGQYAITTDGTNQCVKLDAGKQASQFVIPIADPAEDNTTQFQYAYIANLAGSTQTGDGYEGVWKPTGAASSTTLSCPSYYLNPVEATPQPIFQNNTAGTFSSQFKTDMGNNKSLPAALRAALASGRGFGPSGPLPTGSYNLCNSCPEGTEIQYAKDGPDDKWTAKCVPTQGGKCPYMVGACPGPGPGCVNDVYTCCGGLTSTPAVSQPSLGTGYFEAVYKGSTQYQAGAAGSSKFGPQFLPPTNITTVNVSQPGNTGACWNKVYENGNLDKFYGCVMWTEDGGGKTYTLPPAGSTKVELTGGAGVTCTFTAAPAAAGTCTDAGSFPIMSSTGAGNTQTYCGTCPHGTVYKKSNGNCVTGDVTTLETALDCCVPCPGGEAYYIGADGGGTCTTSSNCSTQLSSSDNTKTAFGPMQVAPGLVTLKKYPSGIAQSANLGTFKQSGRSAAGYWNESRHVTDVAVCGMCPVATETEVQNWLQGEGMGAAAASSAAGTIMGGGGAGGGPCNWGNMSTGAPVSGGASFYYNCPWQKYYVSGQGCTLCNTTTTTPSVYTGDAATITSVPNLVDGACGTCAYTLEQPSSTQTESFANKTDTEPFTVQGL